MKGWFDAFRYDGGPTLYNFSNRTAVSGDIQVITVLVIFLTLFLAFLLIFPGIRKGKFTTFCSVTLSLLVGATILISLCGSCWHIAETTIINNTYRAFSNEKINAQLGAYIGLNHVNITLKALPNDNTDIDYNEQFIWINSQQMAKSFRKALRRGLPFPILTVAEYFTVGEDGLNWGGQYRSAGYFAIIMLWTSFATWILMNLMLMVVPRYGALLMTICGFLMLTTVCGYFGMVPETPLIIHIEGTTLKFQFGWCFWLLLITGGICLTIGVIITTIEIINPHSFSTILEIDYDTPYDRHVIIEDSRGRKFQKKKNLEEPEGIGHRILKRLSSKQKEDNKPLESSSSNKDTNNDSSRMEKSNFELSEIPWTYSYKNSLRHTTEEKEEEDDSTVSYSLNQPHHNTRTNSIYKYSQNKKVPIW